MFLHSAGEKGSLLAHAGEGQGFCRDSSYCNCVERTSIKISSVRQGIPGIIYLLMACIIGKMDGVKMSDSEKKRLKYFFIKHQ